MKEVREGCFQLLDQNKRLLGYVLFAKGQPKSFTPNRLAGSTLNNVYQAVQEGNLDEYELKRVKKDSEPTEDLHFFYVKNHDRREAWRLRKERPAPTEKDLEKELKKLEKLERGASREFEFV